MDGISNTAVFQTANYYSSFLLSTFFVSCIKGIFVFTAVFFVTKKYRNLPPEYKHILWLFTICSFILIPAYTLFKPFDNIEIFTLHNKNHAAYKVLAYLSSPKLTDLNSSIFFTAPRTNLPCKVLQTPRYRCFMPLLIFSIWLTGAFILSLNIIAGRVIISRFLKNTLSDGYKNPKALQVWTPIVKQLSARIGLRMKIQVIKSRNCKLPFTCRFFKPVIVLPHDIEKWPLSRIRIVLLHELIHIKRKDYLTKLISRIICTLYWFMPLTWIAYYKLNFDQEETCDSMVIKSGEIPADYARCIIDFARDTGDHVPLLGTPIHSGGNSMIRRRILHLLSAKNPRSPAVFKHLWTVPLICFFILLLFLSVNPAVSAQYEKLYGTWVNVNYNETPWHYAIQIFNPDNTFAVYENTYDSDPKFYGKSIITDCWVDMEGNTWISEDEYVGAYFKGKKVSQHTLNKVSKSGDTLEWILRSSRSGKYPFEPEIYLQDTFHRILYRK